MSIEKQFEQMLEKYLWRFGSAESWDITKSLTPQGMAYRTRLETMTATYTLVVHERHDDASLAGYAQSKTLNKYGYFGARDLSDGRFAEETFVEILGEMLSFEIMKYKYIMEEGYVISCGGEPTRYGSKKN